MKLNIVSCFFILDNEESNDIRKCNKKHIKILVDNENNLPNILFDNKTDIKELIRNKLYSITNTKIFHLEQVYTNGYSKYFSDNKIDIVYVAIANKSNININSDYKLVDLKFNDNCIYLDNKNYKYKVEEKQNNFNIEYFYKLDTTDINLERKIIEIIIAYKYVKSRLDNTSILFKFMPNTFTLEDVRLTYELLKNKEVDKSNFRKKIIKYCEKVDSDIIIKKGYRPSQNYKYKPVKGDSWI